MKNKNENIKDKELQGNNNIIDETDNKPYIILLSPKDNLPENDCYIEYLKEVLLEEKSCNIALAGDYGSGKSSIIRSFLRYNEGKIEKNLKCMIISLATFKTENADKDALEKSILKQLFYKTDSTTIPKSRFKRITNNKIRRRSVCKLLIAVLAILNPFIIYKFNSFYKIFLNGWNTIIKGIVLIVSLLLAFGGIAWILYKLLNSFSIKSIKASSKLNVEFEKKSQTSDKENAFDVNIDEIMYMFHENKYDVIFFEDLDRFNNSVEIFTSLRELNEILNDTESLPWYKRGRKLKFVYAIKDDIFFDENIEQEEYRNKDGKWNYKKGLENSKVRTKFFDYIIPVMPITDSNNSYEDITEIFRKYNEVNKKNDSNKLKISEGLQADISIYLDDRRLLQNTFNEFLIYHRKHGVGLKRQENGVYDSLFAIMLYKNMYPVDFRKINNNDGTIYSIFKHKKKYIKKIVDNIEDEIEQLNKRVDEIKKECARNKNELWVVYKQINKQQRNYIHFNNGGCTNNFDNMEIGRLADIREDSKNVEGFGNISERIKIVESKANLNDFYIKLKNLKDKKNKIQNSTIKEMLEENIKIFDEVIKDKEILRVLLKRGYISEDFEAYTSVFKKGRISFNDNEFLKMVTEKTELFDKTKEYKLDKPENVFLRINENDLSERESLNLQLLEFIVLGDIEKCRNRVERYMNQFKEIDDYRAEVIVDYINWSDTTATEFIKEIMKINPNLFQEFKVKEDIGKVDIDEIFNRIISCSDIHNISRYLEAHKEHLGAYREYIMNDSHFIYLDVCNWNQEKIKMLIKKLNIKFSYLIANIKKYDNEIAPFIYNENLYELNKAMIKFIIESQRRIECSENFIMYGNILDTKLPKLIKYIDDNISEYVEKIYIKDKYKKDKDEAVIKLLNNERIDIDSRIKIIKEKEFQVKNLISVENKELYSEIMEKRILDTTWENIEVYYKSNSSMDELTKYLNEIDIAKTLAKQSMEDRELQMYILNNEDIYSSNIKYLVRAFTKAFSSIDVFKTQLSSERIELLIDIDMLELSAEIYDKVSLDSNNKVKLISKYIDEFLAKESSIYSIDITEFYKIIDNISQEKKLEMIAKYNADSIDVENHYELLKNIIKETDDNEYIKLKSLIKKAEIRDILEKNTEKTERQLIRKLSSISKEYKLKSTENSFKINIEDELYNFRDELQERGFKIEELEGVEVEISIIKKKK